MSDTARPKTDGAQLGYLEVNRDLPVQMTAGETIDVSSNPISVYIKDADGECYKTDAENDTETIHNFVGFAVTNGSNGVAFTVQTHGIVTGFSGLDAGKVYYLSDTDGAISTTAGTYEKMVGIAISATELWVAPWAYRGLTQKAQIFTGLKTFGTIPVGPGSDPTTDNQLSRKLFIDNSIANRKATKLSAATNLGGGDDFFVISTPLADMSKSTGTVNHSDRTVLIADTGAANEGYVRSLTGVGEFDLTKDFIYQTVLKLTTITENNTRCSWGIKNDTSEVDNQGALTADHALFIFSENNGLYASVADGTTQEDAVITGITTTNYNSYQIRRVGSDMLFYVNGTLEATLSSNLPDTTTNYIEWMTVEGDGGNYITLTIKAGWAYVEPFS